LGAVIVALLDVAEVGPPKPQSGDLYFATKDLDAIVTTVVWVAVTLLTEPTDRATLLSFYRLVRPAGPVWNEIRREAAAGASPDSLPTSLLGWALGCTMVYSALLGTGESIVWSKGPRNGTAFDLRTECNRARVADSATVAGVSGA
jgi:hypothetical protein